MDVVLINPAATGTGINEATVEPPLGLAYIAAVLEENSFKCKIIDQNIFCLPNIKILDEIPDDTKIVGFFMNSFLYNAVKELTYLIKEKNKNIIVLVGGPTPTAVPETVLKDIGCDGVIRGEGEYAVAKIMQNIKEGLSPFDSEVSGAVYYGEDKSIITNPIKRITDLDTLPFPAFHLLPPLSKYKSRSRKTPIAPIVTSRGCPYSCTFCSKDIYQRIVTFRSAQNVLNEIDFLVNKYKIRQLDILDDNFSQNRKRLEAILDGIIKKNYGLAINMQSGIRTESLDESILKKFKKAGVFKLAFGIESADENVLRLHKKMLKLGKVEETVKIAKKLGFIVYGFFIIGLPGETNEGFKKTMAFAEKLDLDIANFCMAIPFVGTELYKMIEDKGRFLVDTSKNIDSGFYDGTVFFIYDNYTEEDLLKRYKMAYKKFYSFGKQLKVLFSIRSISEFIWVSEAFWSIMQGMFKERLNKLKRGIGVG
jgi:radical SAM superfamily enzyme YgiQ (UPF0313 family)